MIDCNVRKNFLGTIFNKYLKDHLGGLKCSTGRYLRENDTTKGRENHAITDNDTGFCNWDFYVCNACGRILRIDSYFLNFEINRECH